MDPSMLNGSHFRNKRAILSVLTHNQIIIGEEGAVANNPEDIEDFEDGLTNDLTGTTIDATHFNDERISLVNPITSPETMFSLSDDFNTFGFDPPWMLEKSQTINDGWRLENWINEYLKKAQPG
jgi:hypothetical protein